MNAAYNEDGELVGTSRPLESAQLPVSISMAVAKKFEGYTVSKKSLELTFEGETRYYLTVSNDQMAYKLKCSSSGDVEVERKMKKN